MQDVSKLSAAAQELLRLCPVKECGGEDAGVDISKVIAEHPELISGLNEYVAYVKEVGIMVAETKETPTIAHDTATTIRTVRAQSQGGQSKPQSRT